MVCGRLRSFVVCCCSRLLTVAHGCGMWVRKKPPEREPGARGRARPAYAINTPRMRQAVRLMKKKRDVTYVCIACNVRMIICMWRNKRNRHSSRFRQLIKLKLKPRLFVVCCRSWSLAVTSGHLRSFAVPLADELLTTIKYFRTILTN